MRSSIWWNTAPALPLPFFCKCREAGIKRRTEEKLKAEKREVRRGEQHQGGKGRQSLDEMNYAKLSEAAIVGGAGCVKGSQPWSPPAPSTTLTTPRGWELSDMCPGKWPAARWEEEGGRFGEQSRTRAHMVTGGLSWRDTAATTSALFITVIYKGQGQGDLSWYVQQRPGKYNYPTKA